VPPPTAAVHRPAPPPSAAVRQQLAAAVAAAAEAQEALAAAKREHEGVVSRLWADMGVLSDILESTRQSLGPVRGACGAREDDDVSRIRARVACARVVERWRAHMDARQAARLSFIAARSYAWVARAKAAAAAAAGKLVDEAAVADFLRGQKTLGLKLSLSQENYLRRGTHEGAGAPRECGVCLESFQLGSMLTLARCRHTFCAGCVRAQIEAELDAGRAARLGCLQAGCREPIPFEDARLALLAAAGAREREALLGRYDRMLLEAHLDADAEHIVRCPKPACQLPMERPSRALRMVVCLSQACGFTFCAQCNVEWHADATCEAFQRWRQENAAGGDLFARWAAQNAKACPSCSAPIVKNGGCNHMTCIAVSGQRHEFCWLCLQPYTPDHFTRDGPCHGKQFT
jgi:hypothetical protein